MDLEHVNKWVHPNENKWKERIMLAWGRWLQQLGKTIVRVLFHS